jgi:capsular polysaccharide biosynthesis protein
VHTAFVPRVVAAVKHQWIVVSVILAIGVLAAGAVLILAHPKYVASTSVLMVAGSAETPNSEGLATSTKPLLSNDLPSLATDTTVIDRMRADVGEPANIDSVRSRIRAKVETDSTIMHIEYTDRSAGKAVAGVNALGNEVTAFYRQLATARFDLLISDLQTQLKSRRSELAKFDGDLADASKAYPFVDVKPDGTGESGSASVFAHLVALREQRDELQASLRADQAIAQSTEQIVRDAQPSAMREIVQSDATYARIRDQYAHDLAELKRISAFGSASYPGLVELRRTVAREAEDVDAARRAAAASGPNSNSAYAAALDARVRAAGQVASDEAKVSEHNRVLRQLYSQIGRRGMATQVAELRRDHDTAEAAYSIISGRLAKSIADRAEAASTGSMVVLGQAQSATRSLVGDGLITATATLFLALWLALTVAVMIDAKQQWFNDSHTIETIYGAPVIGSIA